MKWIVSLPKQDNSDVTELNSDYGFGYFETTNRPFRKTQEDALAWHILSEQQLNALSPNEIAHRLWTCYQLLDTEELIAGTTASTTVYDGRGHFITATLGDAAAFIAVYDTNKEIIAVRRLNTKTHKPTDPEERDRIINSNGKVVFGRVNGALALSRAIGDFKFKQFGVCADASIDILQLDLYISELNINKEAIGLIQIITTCDGFTDGSGINKQEKQHHEEYLLNTLKELYNPGTLAENVLAQFLAYKAKNDGSTDNISVAIQSFSEKTPPFLLGLYDGHGGKEASCKVALNIADYFLMHCQLNSEEYSKLGSSVHCNHLKYNHDNPLSAVNLPFSEDVAVPKKEEIKQFNPLFFKEVTCDSIIDNGEFVEITL